jgi:antitoxin component of MazEF toxin-antitoxin module
MRERPTNPFEYETQAADAVRESRKLRRTGNSYGVTLSRKLLDAAGFSPDTPISLHAEPGRVVITLEGGAYDATRAAGRAALEQYRVAFEKLGK